MSQDLSDNLPVNSIIMWYGLATEVPDGWAICDGSADTPDLVDRFVMGIGTNKRRGEKGGASSVILGENNLPEHSHGLTDTIYKWHRSFVGDDSEPRALTNEKEGSSQEVYVDRTESVGGGEAHENRPPYVGLFFIMKIW